MMELGLKLGESNSKPCVGLGLNTTLSIGPTITTTLTTTSDFHHQEQEEEEEAKKKEKKEKKPNSQSIIDDEVSNNKLNIIPPAALSPNNSLHLIDLLPPTPLSSFPWPPPSHHHNSSEVAATSSRLPWAEDESEERAALSSSPNSAASSFQADLCIYSNNKRGRGSMSGSGNIIIKNNNNNNMKMESESESYYYDQKGGCRGIISDEEDDNNVDGVATRKKLRLSKQQSAFLEDTFKQHSTLNPKEKLALAKQLNLRPRQVEVWFQNRRARTKLKQTEVDCEYLKRCCETLSEENRRLQKELQELKALKKASSSNPFFMQLPATTLTMCPSCERVAPNPTSTTTTTTSNSSSSFPINAKPKFYPFPHSKPHQY